MMRMVKISEEEKLEIREITSKSIEKAGSISAVCKLFRLRSEDVRRWITLYGSPSQRSLISIAKLKEYIK
jgi:transposase-like protein